MFALTGFYILSRPLNKCVTAMQELARNGYLACQLPAHGRDELSQLARSFNAFVDKIR
ncbi:MAG: HAMP domain-containing protein [Candidatus Thiodiazotropha taylori]